MKSRNLGAQCLGLNPYPPQTNCTSVSLPVILGYIKWLSQKESTCMYLFILFLKTRAGVAVWVGGKAEAATGVFGDGKSWGHGLLR